MRAQQEMAPKSSWGAELGARPFRAKISNLTNNRLSPTTDRFKSGQFVKYRDCVCEAHNDRVIFATS
jgi:hypothetical protein